jgi:hypothetical protein
MTDSALGGGDLRTLSYASLRIDEAMLARLMAYQRALADRLSPGWDAEAMARAHRDALADAGLTAEELERPLAVLRRFAGNRETAARLQAAEAAATGDDRAAIQDRLSALEAQLRERDDAETIERLLAREAELLELHRRTRGALER